MTFLRGLLLLIFLLVAVGHGVMAAPQTDEELTEWRYLIDEDFEAGTLSPLMIFNGTHEFITEESNPFLRLTSTNYDTFNITLGDRGADFRMSARLRIESNVSVDWGIKAIDDGCLRYNTHLATNVPVKTNMFYPLAEGGCQAVVAVESESGITIPTNEWFDWQMEMVDAAMTVSINDQPAISIQRDSSQFGIIEILVYRQVDIDDLQIELQIPQSEYIPPPITEWETRFNHFRGVRLKLPSDFERALINPSTYANNSLSVQIRGWSWTSSVQTLQETCEDRRDIFSQGGAIEVYERHCIITPAIEWAFPAIAVVFPPSTIAGEAVAGDQINDYYTFSGDEAILRPLAETVEFPETPTAVEYLSEGLDFIEAHYLYLNDLDWAQISEQAMMMVNEDSSLEDAHAALTFVREQFHAIGDTHSSFSPPADAENDRQNSNIGMGIRFQSIDDGYLIKLIYPEGPANGAGLQVGDFIETINDLSVAEYETAVASGEIDENTLLTLRVRRAGQANPLELSLYRGDYSRFLPVIGRRLVNKLGYIETFHIAINASFEVKTRYITEAHQLIREIDQQPVCGWIVDVRRNTGGDAIMPIAYAPLLGETTLYGYQNHKSTNIDWFSYHDGIIDTTRTSFRGVRTLFTLEPYQVQRLNAPVAVLVSPDTASAGEYTAMVFKSRSDASTQIFGEETRGLLTDSVVEITFWDGASLGLTYSRSVGADGQPFPESIIPDVVMETDYSTYGTDDDPMIQAAAAWLAEQPECQ